MKGYAGMCWAYRYTYTHMFSLHIAICVYVGFRDKVQRVPYLVSGLRKGSIGIMKGYIRGYTGMHVYVGTIGF